MVNFLRKLFIKNYKDINNPKVREKHGILAAVGGIFMNIILFVIKLLIGLISGSLSIISDAINNLTDLFSCFVTLFGFKISNMKASAKHPYGHERIEYIAGMIVSFIIIVVAVLLGYTSVNKLINHESETNYSIITFIILVISIGFKFLLGLYYKKIGNIIDSISLKAAMQDSLNDSISTGCVLIAAVLQFVFPNLWWIDPVISIVVALFILYSGIKLVFETAQPLIGLSPDNEFVKEVVDFIKSHDGVLGIHDVVCHSYGPTKKFMTAHVEVDGYKSMFDSHDLIDEIEAECNKKFNMEITIHMDPIDTKNKEIPLVKNRINEILKNIDDRLTFHDLRMVAGPTHTNVIFDVVIPFDFKTNEGLQSLVQKELNKMDNKYRVVIKIDYNYVG